MATRIIEYSTNGKSVRTVYPAPSIVEQTPITATTTSAQSSAFSASTDMVAIDSDEKVYVKFGENPTATTSCITVPAGGCKEFEIPKGASLKVAIRS